MGLYSDLIGDNLKLFESGKAYLDGESKFDFKNNDVIIERYNIVTQETSDALGLPKGKYALVTLPNVHMVTETIVKYYIQTLTRVIKSYFPSKYSSVLVVGLGNRYLVADSLGVKTIKNINVTGKRKGKVSVYALAPSVMGLTGIESSDIVEAVINKIKPDLIVIIDSLCASSVSRLGSSFQITDFAFVPGSGVNNTRKPINFNNNVVSIGVPLVVYAQAFVKEAFAQLKIKSKLDNYDNNQIVTPKDIDVIATKSAYIISSAINKAIFQKRN